MDASVLRKSCSNGASEMVSQCSAAVTTFLFNVTMMKLLGEDGVAAITVIIYSQFLLTTFYIGFSMGIAPVISYNYGSGKQLKRIVRICFRFITGISILVFLFSMLGGETIAKIFAENNRNVLRLPRMDSAFFHSVFCSQDAIFFHLLYSREQRAKGACLHAHLATVAGALTYGIIERKSICSHIFPADVWIYYSVPFGIAGILRGDGCMACCSACGVFHADADGCFVGGI